MPVNLPAVHDLLAVPGVEVGTANAGIKQTERDDVVVLTLPEGTVVAGVIIQ